MTDDVRPTADPDRTGMMLGCEFEAHRPSELAEHLRTLGARLTRAAGS
ncbi:hypothetical protein ACRYCC_38995 [Actinomadura scrupuli]